MAHNAVAAVSGCNDGVKLLSATPAASTSESFAHLLVDLLATVSNAWGSSGTAVGSAVAGPVYPDDPHHGVLERWAIERLLEVQA
jgi:hypothetical protein